MNDFDRLNKISRNNGDILMFPLPNNIVTELDRLTDHRENNEFEYMTIAVKKGTLERFENNEVIGAVYIISKKEWDDTKEVI